MTTKTDAQIEDLYRLTGKAEIVNGEIVEITPTGDDPGYASGEIFVSLRNYARQTKSGRATGDNVGFLLQLPDRKSFSLDAAFHNLPRSGMKFLTGAPLFAVEVRSENDYGPTAEEKMAQKRIDYFAAGTLVVWDVDLLSNDVIKVYRNTDPTTPTIYRRGDFAEAEPALPGWSLLVDELFPIAE